MKLFAATGEQPTPDGRLSSNFKLPSTSETNGHAHGEEGERKIDLIDEKHMPDHKSEEFVEYVLLTREGTGLYDMTLSAMLGTFAIPEPEVEGSSSYDEAVKRNERRRK